MTFHRTLPSTMFLLLAVALAPIHARGQDHLVVTCSPPASAVINVAIPCSVTAVRDVDGTVDTVYNQEVTFSSSTDSKAVPNPPTHQFVATDRGAFSFSVTFDIPGADQLVAATPSGSQTYYSGAFGVAHDAATPPPQITSTAPPTDFFAIACPQGTDPGWYQCSATPLDAHTGLPDKTFNHQITITDPTDPNPGTPLPATPTVTNGAAITVPLIIGSSQATEIIAISSGSGNSARTDYSATFKADGQPTCLPLTSQSSWHRTLVAAAPKTSDDFNKFFELYLDCSDQLAPSNIADLDSAKRQSVEGDLLDLYIVFNGAPAHKDHGIEAKFQDLFSAVGMVNSIAAELEAGTALAWSGSPSVPSITGSAQNLAVGMLRIESNHFGHNAQSWLGLDGSILGDLGYEPVLAPFTAAATPTGGGTVTSNPALRTSYVSGLDADFGGRVSHAINDNGEVFFASRTGLTVLDTTLNAADQANSNGTTSATLADNASSAAGFIEAGLGLRLYAESLEQVEIEKNYFTPAIYLEGGIRKDDRFARAGSSLTNYQDPFLRSYVRAEFNVLQVGGLPSAISGSAGQQNNAANSPPSPVSVRFAIDYQGHWPNSGQHSFHIPPGTSLLIISNIDLMSVLKGTSK